MNIKTIQEETMALYMKRTITLPISLDGESPVAMLWFFLGLKKICNALVSFKD